MTQKRPSALVTLTYNDEHLPRDGSVSPRDTELFNKRLRYYFDYYSKNTRKIKMYWSSEYGEEDFRPHYHYMIFGFDPDNSFDLECLARAWSEKKGSKPFGFWTADYLNSARIRYCLKYVHKEFTPERQDDIEKRGLKPLFHSCSNGIGFDWFFQNLSHIIEHRGYVVNGVVRPLNRYYADLFKLIEQDRSYQEVYKSVIERVNEKGHNFSLVRSLPMTYDPNLFYNSVRENFMKHKSFMENEL